MKTILFALLQIILASGILYSYYHLFLRNKRFHQYNRFYLLAATVISVSVPFLQIPVYFSSAQTSSSIVLQTLTNFSYGAIEMSQEATVQPIVAESWFTLEHISYSIYIGVAVVFLLKIIVSLAKIISIARNNPVRRTDKLNFVNTDEPGTPFSFFKWLFWNRNIDLQSEKGEQVFRHEAFHIREKHSLDVMFLELLTTVFWINPFFHLIRKEIKAIHEFLADQHASQGDNQWKYAELLLMHALNTRQSLVNPFFHNQIKRRIAMITTSNKSSYQYLRKILVLPVAFLVIGLFAFTYKNSNEQKTISVKLPMTVVIDAGHGGIDAGAKSIDRQFNEAAISLSIAKEIQELAGEYNVKVIMTRENDKMPGDAPTITDGLKNRVAITNSANADAFVSIHINAAGNGKEPSKATGFEVYIASKKINGKESRLASAILQQMTPIYSTRKEIRSRNDKGVYILEKNDCPSILLQCGVITNPQDLAFITDKNNQQKIARGILEGLVQYRSSPINASTNNIKISGDTIEPVKVNEQTVYEKVEINAAFPGGKEKWKQYLKRNMDDAVATKNNAPTGVYSIFVQFIVNKDGSIRDIKPLTNHGFGMEAEAIRLIKKGPYWRPALISGKPVSAYTRQRIDFKAGGTIKSTAKATQTLSDIVFVAYNPHKGSIDGALSNASLPATEAGSTAWNRFFERHINSLLPIKEGWSNGVYKVLVQFSTNEAGDVADVTALNYTNTATAQQCVGMLRKVEKVKTVSGSLKQNYIQPFIFRIVPDEKIVLYKLIKPLQTQAKAAPSHFSQAVNRSA